MHLLLRCGAPIMYPPLVKYLELWGTFPLASHYYFLLYFLIFYLLYFSCVACEYTCQPLQVLVEMRTERNMYYYYLWD